MGDKSFRNREVKKKKKEVATSVNAPVLKSVVTQPEIITRTKKEK